MTLTGGFSSNEEHASEMFLPAERRTLREESARASLCFLSYNEVVGVFFFPSAKLCCWCERLLLERAPAVSATLQEQLHSLLCVFVSKIRNFCSRTLTSVSSLSLFW